MKSELTYARSSVHIHIYNNIETTMLVRSVLMSILVHIAMLYVYYIAYNIREQQLAREINNISRLSQPAESCYAKTLSQRFFQRVFGVRGRDLHESKALIAVCFPLKTQKLYSSLKIFDFHENR